MKKFIIIGFQNNPKSQPKILKEFYNGGSNPAVGALAGMAGISSDNQKIDYSEGLENALIFEQENAAGLVQQSLNSSFHGRYNSWCVREITEKTIISDLVKDFLKANSHIDSYKKALEEII